MRANNIALVALPRSQHDANAGSQRLRPLLRWAQNRCRPVERAHPRAHVAAPANTGSINCVLMKSMLESLDSAIAPSDMRNRIDLQDRLTYFRSGRDAILAGEAAEERRAAIAVQA